MEPWQNDHVTKNINKLMETTTCSQMLLSKLQAKGILVAADLGTLNSLNIPMDKSRKLFDILVTRVNAYKVATEALLEERQTGAANILLQGYHSLPGLLTGLTYDNNILLGRGCRNTRVYEGRFGSIPVAVKVVNCDDIDKKVVVKEVERFQDLMTHNIENIIRYYLAVEEKNFMLIALELCNYNLAECIKGAKLRISEQIEIVLMQITKGLYFLHENGIIHLDLKPENILLKLEHDGKIIVKIADFGIAKKIVKLDDTALTLHTSSGIGTAGWMAPEIQKNTGGLGPIRASRAADIFSLGCVFYYVLSNGLHPFGDHLHNVANIADNKPQMKISHFKDLFPDYFWLIRLMVNQNQVQRPTTKFILEHVVFWKSAIKIKFVSEIGNLIRNTTSLSPLTKRCLLSYSVFLSRLDGAASVVSNTWVNRLCLHVKNYVVSKVLPKLRFTSIENLILTITQLYDDYERLPEDVKASLGDMPNEFLQYWTSRFPFLISTLWMHFEAMEKEGPLRLYYHEKFHHSYNTPAAELATLEAFKTPGKGVNFYKERIRLQKEIRAEASPMEIIGEGSIEDDIEEATHNLAAAQLSPIQTQHVRPKAEAPALLGNAPKRNSLDLDVDFVTEAMDIPDTGRTSSLLRKLSVENHNTNPTNVNSSVKNLSPSEIAGTTGVC